ncbi:hypothetical protein Plhal304r1_c028g0093011 [Plasmopara halstedii]
MPLDGITTGNNFHAFQLMSASFEPRDVTSDKKYGKHYTKMKKASTASPVMEVTESMLGGENTALLNTLPDRIAQANKKATECVSRSR